MKIQTVEFVRGAAKWEHLPDDGVPEVAFIGRSNVGKSSLLNMIVGRKEIARTSNTPGKTQELNYYRVNERFYLVDLPGYGYARVSKVQRARWGRLIGRYLTEREPLRVVFHLIDSRHAPTALDEDIIDTMREAVAPYVIVLTKGDKLSGNGRVKSEARVRELLERAALDVPLVLTSAKTGRGRNELLDWLRTLA